MSRTLIAETNNHQQEGKTGRKRTDADPPLSKIVRAMFDGLGRLDVHLNQARQWLKQNHPTLIVNENSLKTALSTERRLRKVADTSTQQKAAAPSPVKKTAAPPVFSPEVSNGKEEAAGDQKYAATSEDMRRLLDVTTNVQGGLEACASALETASYLANAFGGLGRAKSVLSQVIELQQLMSPGLPSTSKELP